MSDERKRWVVMSPIRVLYWREFNANGTQCKGEWVEEADRATLYHKEEAEALAERLGGFAAIEGKAAEAKPADPGLLADLLSEDTKRRTAESADPESAEKPEPIQIRQMEGFEWMTIRDQFAAKVAAALVVNMGTLQPGRKQIEVDNVTAFVAERAYQYADAMIQARKPKG